MANNIAEVFLDDRLTEILVRKVIVNQKIVIEEMAERSMPDVVQETGYAHVLFDEWRRWALIAEDFAQRGIKMFGKLTGKMHGAERVLEPAMLSRGIDPAGALQLADPA